MKRFVIVLAMVLWFVSPSLASVQIIGNGNVFNGNGSNCCLLGPKGDRGEIGPVGPAGKDGVGIQGEKGDTGAGEVTKRESPLGYGADVILWQSPKEVFGLEAQYKYDDRNNEHSAFAVAKINLWKLFKK